MRKTSDQQLPWGETAAALIAFAALTVTGGLSPVLPLLGLGLLATYAFTPRMGPADWWMHWALRLALYAGIGILTASKPNEGLVDSVLSAQAMDTWGQVMAAELVIQAWRRQPSRPPITASMILLSGLTLAAACQTSDERYPRMFVPLYMVCLLLFLASRKGGDLGLRWIAVAVALGAGAATYGVVWTNRVALNVWGMRYMEGRAGPEAAGLSSTPSLGETFGLRGSPRRVLRIVGLHGVAYLRGLAFDTYGGGSWGPRADRRDYGPIGIAWNATGPRAHVQPLANTDALLLIPLNCAGVDAGDNENARWAADVGGPLKTLEPQPEPYDIIQSTAEDYQGPVASRPSPAEIQRCLSVPPDIDPRVKDLARQIVQKEDTPQGCIREVEAYLVSHHRYSLTIHPGPGDPVSNFLLQTPPKAAHCEFFAASAVILLRCLRVPARYVIGYYAHERDGPGVTIVRQRDAHAWAEAWVAGRGWVTVDATPGDGRPEADDTSVPLWQQLFERMTDGAATLRAWLLGLPWTQVCLSASILAAAALLAPALWRRLHRRQEAPVALPDYAGIDPDFVSLAGRFGSLLDRQGLPCPPQTPWREHLAETETNSPSVEEFVRSYNALRFGGAANAQTARLPELLSEAEREAAREKTKEPG